MKCLAGVGQAQRVVLVIVEGVGLPSLEQRHVRVHPRSLHTVAIGLGMKVGVGVAFSMAIFTNDQTERHDRCRPSSSASV